MMTYNIMIKGLCKEGLIDEVSELLKKMDGLFCSPNECTYNTIIQGLQRHNETSRAMKYLHIVVEKGSQQMLPLQPCLLTCCQLLRQIKTFKSCIKSLDEGF